MKKFILSVTWLVMIAALAACGGSGGSTSAAVTQIEPSGDEREIMIKGSNFTFDQEEYEVTVGEPVRIVYQNAEGNHAVSVKRTDITLRHGEETVVTFSEPGTYEIICNLYCGAGHANMSAKFIVE